MNSISLENLWQYLQGLQLSSKNKRWLAEHLYASADSQQQSDSLNTSEWPVLTGEDLVLSPETLSIVQDVEPLPEDYDIEKARLEYLKLKIG